MQKLATIFPRFSVFFEQVIAPHSIRSMIQSLNISVWTPSSFLSRRLSARAWGIRPMPHSIVLPSSTRRARFCPIIRSVSSRTGTSVSMTSSSWAMSMSIPLTWMKLSPKVRGIRSLTWAMTYRALAAADLTMSTETPSEQSPCASGGVTAISATSMGTRPDSNWRGISERKIGV